MLRRAALAAVVVCIASGAASAGSTGKTYVIASELQAGPIALAHTTLPLATMAFKNRGRRVIHRHPAVCLVTWPRIGLTVNFGLVGNDPRDRCTVGVALVVTVTSRGAWRSSAGLRVGDPVARLRQLYPRATAHLHDLGQAGYWLVTRRMCAEVGGLHYAALLARVRNGHVSAFVASAGVCD